MKARLCALGWLLILSTMIVSGCAPSTTQPTEVPTPTPTEVVVETPAGDFQPLSPTACSKLASAMAQTLGVEVATEEAPFQDYISGKTGAGCQATATGTGLDFGDFWAVAEGLKGMLKAQGWQENISYMADGPTGTGSGFHKDNGLCLLLAGWEPSEDADCPPDQPIGLCELSPEQMLYTITLNCAQDTSTPGA